MKSILLRAISLILSVAMLALFAPFANRSESYDLKDPEACVLHFTVFSDVHVEGNNSPRYKVFAASLKDAMKNRSGSDAFLFLGDSTMNGQNIENMFFHGTVATILKDQRVIPVPGNHDFGNGAGDFEKIQQRWYDYTEAFFGLKLTTPYYYQVVNGCYFIVLANEQQNIDRMHMSDEQFAWLEATLEQAAQSGMPTFVLAHYPPRMEDHINPDSPYNLCGMLASFNREHDLFYLCGHLHQAPSSSTFHGWSGFPETYLPMLTQLTDDGDRNVCDETGFGEIVEVYADRVVFRVRNFYFGEWATLNDAPMEATYTLKNPVPAA